MEILDDMFLDKSIDFAEEVYDLMLSKLQSCILQSDMKLGINADKMQKEMNVYISGGYHYIGITKQDIITLSHAELTEKIIKLAESKIISYLK